jgi:16S rRNA processing protein RimM
VAFAAGAPNLRRGRRAWLGGLQVTITASRAAGDAWVLGVEGIADRTTADRFRGQLFEMPDAEVERASPDSYFVHELIGLRVVTAEGEELGRIVDVLQPGANDVYVVEGPGGEVLIPAIAEVVVSIDLPVSVMVITPLPGLLDGSA